MEEELVRILEKHDFFKSEWAKIRGEIKSVNRGKDYALVSTETARLFTPHGLAEHYHYDSWLCLIFMPKEVLHLVSHKDHEHEPQRMNFYKNLRLKEGPKFVTLGYDDIEGGGRVEARYRWISKQTQGNRRREYKIEEFGK